MAGLVLEYGGSGDQAVAALLHDVVEDQRATLTEVREEFGQTVTRTVAELTRLAFSEDVQASPSARETLYNIDEEPQNRDWLRNLPPPSSAARVASEDLDD